MQDVIFSKNSRKLLKHFILFSVNITVNSSPGGITKRLKNITGWTHTPCRNQLMG